jgi:hypothetical protein
MSRTGLLSDAIHTLKGKMQHPATLDLDELTTPGGNRARFTFSFESDSDTTQLRGTEVQDNLLFRTEMPVFH